MSDIVEMLRSIAEPIDGSDLWVIREAADEIERLRDELEAQKTWGSMLLGAMARESGANP